MSKQRVVETFIGGSTNTTTINAADASIALQVAQQFYDGELQVLEESTAITSSTPSANIVGSYAVSVLIRNPSANKSKFLNFNVDDSFDEPDVIDALMGKTISGVKAEDVKIHKFVHMAA